jgi:hypothetical protein
MRKRFSVFLMTLLLTLALGVAALAANYVISVEVFCDDSFTRELIRDYVLGELRNIQGVTVAEKGENPHLDLSISAVKTADSRVALSVMKVQHIWSKEINPSSGKHDYAIFRADHYVAVFPVVRLKQTCSEIVTEFDATYVESLRR